MPQEIAAAWRDRTSGFAEHEPSADNPLEDIRNTAKIEAVIRKGRYLSNADLAAMKSAVASLE